LIARLSLLPATSLEQLQHLLTGATWDPLALDEQRVARPEAPPGVRDWKTISFMTHFWLWKHKMSPPIWKHKVSSPPSYAFSHTQRADSEKVLPLFLVHL
jgi:hypothetical protein